MILNYDEKMKDGTDTQSSYPCTASMFCAVHKYGCLQNTSVLFVHLTRYVDVRSKLKGFDEMQCSDVKTNSDERYQADLNGLMEGHVL